ncbi:MAG: TIGR02186 family protein [Rickettsiales bacterium]|nr:TIGR02186 family protein [Rickettsiales bacterium]
MLKVIFKTHFVSITLYLFLLLKPASANQAIFTALSENTIDIQASFQGKSILLFGAKDEAGDIFIVVRGPEKSFITRKKEKIFGFWVDRKYVEFNNLPNLYQIKSNHPLESISNKNLLKNLEIGLDNLSYNYGGNASIDQTNTYREALMESQFKNALFDKNIGAIKYLNNTFFKTEIFFPKTIQEGLYTIETYLIDQSKIKALQVHRVHARKVGFESYIHKTAHERPIIYGLISISLALIFGWIASHIFWRP